MKALGMVLVILALSYGLFLLGDAVTTHHGQQACQGQPTEGCTP